MDRWVLDDLIQSHAVFEHTLLIASFSFTHLLLVVLKIKPRPLHILGSASEPHSSLVCTLNPLFDYSQCLQDVSAVSMVLMVCCLGNSNEKCTRGLKKVFLFFVEC